MRNWIISAVVIAVAAFALWRFTRSPGPEAVAETAEPAAETVPSDDTEAPNPHRDRPTLDGVPARLPGKVPARRYETEDGRVVVRDHRKSSTSVPHRPPMRPPGSKRGAVERATIGRIRLAVRPAVKDCVADSGADIPAGARLQVVVYTDIAAGVATAGGLEITGTAPADIEDCVRAKMTALRVEVPEAADVEGYPFNFPFDLTRLR